MPKIPDCDRCLLYAHDPHLVCAVHPHGPMCDRCLDFRLDPDWQPEEPWQPESASFYGDELVIEPVQRWTREQKLALLDTHPLFTGRCPDCEMPMLQTHPPRTHWDCSHCGWKDDSV